jgi:hypothetical protein
MKKKKKNSASSFPFGKMAVPVIVFIAIVWAWTQVSSTLSGKGLAHQLAAKPSVNQLKNGDYKQINAENPGEQLSLTKFAVRNKYTIFDFSSVF